MLAAYEAQACVREERRVTAGVLFVARRTVYWLAGAGRVGSVDYGSGEEVGVALRTSCLVTPLARALSHSQLFAAAFTTYIL